MDNAKEPIEIPDKVITIKPFQGLNESNLMTLPFISLKRKKEPVLIRKWIKGNQEVGLRVVGGERGCPTMYDLDVLLALFRLLIKSIDNKYTLKDNKVDFPKKINFTYRKLAKEMGFKNFGSGIKNRLENSIKTLNETTIYSSFAFRDQEQGKYIKTFKGEQSCRIICDFKSYSVEEQKINGDKLANPKEIEQKQSVKIDEFFYANMCNNYFKLYDHEKYIRLTRNIAKKILLILTQWSNGYEKYLNMQTIYDYVGLDVTDKKQEYYYNNELKKALDELKDVNFIKEYDFKVGEGITFIFNVTQKIKSKRLDKYKTDAEVISRLREIGVSYEDINKFVKMDTLSYISAMLRYVDNRYEKGLVDDILKYTQKGLPYGKYEVSEYEIEL
ncbi:replication initiator protein A [Clostridium butyricum]|uniref:replication initiator protein A n=1 Tax=Clostridium butyricum TaxID=1492 RepID=UPI00325AA910